MSTFLDDKMNSIQFKFILFSFIFLTVEPMNNNHCLIENVVLNCRGWTGTNLPQNMVLNITILDLSYSPNLNSLEGLQNFASLRILRLVSTKKILRLKTRWFSTLKDLEVFDMRENNITLTYEHLPADVFQANTKLRYGFQ